MGHLAARALNAPIALAVLAFGGIGAFASGGCGPSLRAATVIQQSVTEKNGMLVDYPPPPAQVEFVRQDPGPPCRWVDGEWKYIEQTWQWVGGAWYVAPEGCVFAQSAMLWFPDRKIGKLYYLGGRWVRPSPEDPEDLVTCGAAKLCRVRR